jgi:hypothetical protein
MKVRGNHPLAEIIERKLFGISNVPKEQQDRMINRACKAVVEAHKQDLIENMPTVEEIMKVIYDNRHSSNRKDEAKAIHKLISRKVRAVQCQRQLKK